MSMAFPNTSEKRSVLFVIDSMDAGGAERVTLTLAGIFAAHGYRVDLIICDDLVTYEIPDSIHLHVLGFEKSFAAYPRYAKKLGRMIETLQRAHGKPYDLILVALQKATRLMKRFRHPNVYHIVHSTFSQSAFKNKKGLKRFFRRRKLHRVYNDLNIIAVSKGIQDDLVDVIGVRPASIRTIYNPIDKEKIRTLAEESNPVTEPDYIVHVGRLSQVKRHDVLLRAYHESGLGCKLVLVGEGEERSAIETLIAELDLQDKVILAGFMPNPYPIIKGARLLVLSSEYEGLPTVLVEALMLGTLPVSTDCKSGPNEILIEELGAFLAAVNRPDDLAGKILAAHEGGIEIREALYERFLPKNVFAQYEGLID